MLNAAIIGLGKWGRTLVACVQDAPDSGIRFTAAATGRPEASRDWAAANGIRLHQSYAAALADPAVQAVVIATPHAQHAEQVIAAARAGKHVFVEKPFTLNQASAAAAVAACVEAGVILALGHNRRFLPAMRAMRALLAEGSLGTLLHVEGHFGGPGGYGYKPGTWRADTAESPLGGMGGSGIHMLDTFIHLAGPLDRVGVESTARVLTNGLDDTTAMLCRFTSGALGTLVTLAAAPRYWRVALFGSEGMAEMRGLEHLAFTPREGEGWLRDFPPTDIERAELAAFAAAVAGGPAYPLSPAEAVHGVAVFEAMVRAANTGRMEAVSPSAPSA
ncbi:Gfo/Idh/MocA family protein [Falsiroseomonas sp. E2-1-a4]|uniref:Gfo/Idh/MocA family protein n=1 Tax=Falsiroseomonas sp. E2-1-a4 TaxID=3239299 RepID=UPI003F2AF7CA